MQLEQILQLLVGEIPVANEIDVVNGGNRTFIAIQTNRNPVSRKLFRCCLYPGIVPALSNVWTQLLQLPAVGGVNGGVFRTSDHRGGGEGRAWVAGGGELKGEK